MRVDTVDITYKDCMWIHASITLKYYVISMGPDKFHLILAIPSRLCKEHKLNETCVSSLLCNEAPIKRETDNIKIK